MYADITQSQWAYLAGIVDGEGCIQIIRRSGSKMSHYYTLTVAVTNTNAALIQWLTTTFEGSSIHYKRPTTSGKNVWAWMVAAQKADAVCRGILPFLIVKKDQAELALRFQATFAEQRNRYNPLTAELIEFRSQCQQEMKHLKTKQETLAVTSRRVS